MRFGKKVQKRRSLETLVRYNQAIVRKAKRENNKALWVKTIIINTDSINY